VHSVHSVSFCASALVATVTVTKNLSQQLPWASQTEDWSAGRWSKFRSFVSYLRFDRIFRCKRQVATIDGGPFLCRHIDVFSHDGYQPSIVNHYTLCEGFKSAGFCRLSGSRHATEYKGCACARLALRNAETASSYLRGILTRFIVFFLFPFRIDFAILVEPHCNHSRFADCRYERCWVFAEGLLHAWQRFFKYLSHLRTAEVS
jgi:hypothetical protein